MDRTGCDTMKKTITVEHEIEYEGEYCGVECKQRGWIDNHENDACLCYREELIDEGDCGEELLRCDACLKATGDGPVETPSEYARRMIAGVEQAHKNAADSKLTFGDKPEEVTK